MLPSSFFETILCFAKVYVMHSLKIHLGFLGLLLETALEDKCGVKQILDAPAPVLGFASETQVEGLHVSPVRKGLALLLSWTWCSGRQKKFQPSVRHWT